VNRPLSTDHDYNLWVLIHQARDAVFKAREKELSQHGVTAMEAAALFIISTIGNTATPADISRWMFREHHTVSALLSRMESKGLIAKVKDQTKKNTWRVSLTEKGQSAFRESAKRESIHAAMSPLTKNERQRFESYLKKVRDEALKHSVSELTLPFPYSLTPTARVLALVQLVDVS